MMKSLPPLQELKKFRLFLAYALFKDFVVYQMDVKSDFLYGKIEEEVYVCQPPGFKDLDFPDRVYKVEKVLYGLHQAPRTWYETLLTYLLDNGFQRGKIDKTLFIKRYKGDILLVQVYVDDIIFGSTKKELCIAFEKLMHDKFQMSSMGELTFFLGLQVKFTKVKTASTPMETQNPLLKDEDGEEVDVHMYRSIIGSLMYLTSSRPDIMYLKGQPKLGLWYPKDSLFNLVAYTDSDYAEQAWIGSLQQEIFIDNNSTMLALEDYSIFDLSSDDQENGAKLHKQKICQRIWRNIEPKKLIQALKDPSKIEAMQEELLQFKLQEVWTSVELPNGKRALSTKWVFKNKKDERGIVIKNKARLVAQGYTQKEGIDYDKVFAPVTRIEEIRLFLAYA
ncbi:putative ribonuclease H-like domain-containing protein [Tanacetum coccineum]